MTTKDFIQYASERPELCEKMSACTAPEEAYAIARGEGLLDDIDTFTEVMSAAKKEMEALSDKDLKQINAAGSTTAVATSVVSLTAAGAIAAAF